MIRSTENFSSSLILLLPWRILNTDGFTDSRKGLSRSGKAGGAGSHKKEVACHIKSELELSGVLIDK